MEKRKVPASKKDKYNPHKEKKIKYNKDRNRHTSISQQELLNAVNNGNDELIEEIEKYYLEENI